MRSKGVWALVVVFVVLVAVASLYTLRERRPHTQTPYSSLEADSLLRVEIRKGDTTSIFERIGGQWELTQPFSYRADQDALTNLLKKLAELELGEVISANPDKFPTFQVDDSSGVLVKAYGRGERPAISVILGKMSSDFQHCYLRFPQRGKVYMVRGVSRYMADRKVDDWRDKTILSFDTEKVIELAYIYPNTKFSLTKEEGKWMLEKQEADSTKVTQVLSLLSDFKADGFKDGGELEPQLTLVIKLEDETEKKLLIDEEDEKGKYLTKREDRETVFWIHSWKVDRLKKETKDFF